MPTRYTKAEIAEMKERESAKWAPAIVVGGVLFIVTLVLVITVVYVRINFGVY